MENTAPTSDVPNGVEIARHLCGGALAGTNAQVPAGRLGQISDISQMCVYLCSAAGGFVTGETVVVDGGSWLYKRPPLPREAVGYWPHPVPPVRKRAHAVCLRVIIFVLDHPSTRGLRKSSLSLIDRCPNASGWHDRKAGRSREPCHARLCWQKQALGRSSCMHRCF